jgi:hypothetical protein
VQEASHVESATIRAARAVGIFCALLFFAPIPLSLVFPAAFLYQPYHLVYERIFAALQFSLGLGLVLALRDPVRNAGVYAISGLIAGSLTAAIVYGLLLESSDTAHWWAQVPILAVAAVLLVVTYARLRRPHPVVVRIVVAAIVLLPAGLYLYDTTYRAVVPH